MEQKKLRVGIIGAGGIARTVHIPSYLSLKDQVELVAITDVQPKHAQAAAEQFSIPYVYNDASRMMQEVELDAVSICTPNAFHRELTIEALHAGCHVLCEKPPAITVEDAKQMEAAAKETGNLLTYGFHYRHSPEVETLKRFVDEGELGEIYHVRVQAIRRRGIPGWGVFTNKELQGGGPLIDIGVHMLDTALYVMGFPEPATILGQTHRKIGTKEGVGLLGEWNWQQFSIEDMAVGMITFKNGASLTIETAFAANVKEQDHMNVSFFGDKGGADLFPLSIYQEKHRTLLDITPVYLPTYNHHEREIKHFVDCCFRLEQPLATPEQGIVIQRLIQGLYQSAESGKAIQW
ncbi:Gfo/Idh/MocA family oxidoreductase [Halalkalibacterium halodurans]|uniref:BH2165 protein n=2 Tax=Halalkalibacterium halodurans TaxID=86665 RepID=Q9KAX1_HALH5|nr:Gfo/Idh/MocA family oxidoreductase [Halalkalibacterium halodurans]MDY7222721.1 Gfo/Idh/MocA family oxidoreductase [Halalkalibacterium halodurans]MDY7241942.1 Gfo/Idh/MocA family oxidoreductase [Halalkalibacterium halodurans]MED4082987.1 Gfo/Idh/MocA family oxidoreductase [Halalkalibacterium halodurans]MED4087148.1 Gfo/Idh/MocA family oxidoreductase [Halalkalibacterium halodurans]MED4107009.1 Gfo/Idh/MocA family oxidoreductase [Halalkalibacterium halodurans]